LPQHNTQYWKWKDCCYWQCHRGHCLGSLKFNARLPSVTTRSQDSSVTRPLPPRSTGVKTVCGFVLYLQKLENNSAGPYRKFEAG
jgi:hypothetical protein